MKMKKERMGGRETTTLSLSLSIYIYISLSLSPSGACFVLSCLQLAKLVRAIHLQLSRFYASRRADRSRATSLQSLSWSYQESKKVGGGERSWAPSCPSKPSCTCNLTRTKLLVACCCRVPLDVDGNENEQLLATVCKLGALQGQVDLQGVFLKIDDFIKPKESCTGIPGEQALLRKSNT